MLPRLGKAETGDPIPLEIKVGNNQINDGAATLPELVRPANGSSHQQHVAGVFEKHLQKFRRRQFIFDEKNGLYRHSRICSLINTGLANSFLLACLIAIHLVYQLRQPVWKKHTPGHAEIEKRPRHC